MKYKITFEKYGEFIIEAASEAEAWERVQMENIKEDEISWCDEFIPTVIEEYEEVGEWKINPDINSERQWIYKDKVMIDLCANGKYIVNVYSEFINDFIYIGKSWDSVKDAKKFVESIF